MKNLFALSALVVLAACQPSASSGTRPAYSVQEVYVYIDSGTGCQYVVPNGSHGIYPRMSADGKQVCSKP